MVHGEASWGQGERGMEGYKDSGGSELIYLGEKLGLIGGATAGESGAYKRDNKSTGGTWSRRSQRRHLPKLILHWT